MCDQLDMVSYCGPNEPFTHTINVIKILIKLFLSNILFRCMKAGQCVFTLFQMT